MCSELHRLKGSDLEENCSAEEENPELFALQVTGSVLVFVLGYSAEIYKPSVFLQGAHTEERLRIEIVNLKEQLEMRTEDSGLSTCFFILFVSSSF